MNDEKRLQPYMDFEAAQRMDYLEVDVPQYIKRNLTDKFDLRYYQNEAITYFQKYLNDKSRELESDHILYQMATGSGKTVIMAANIIELYKRGYRNFVFFVDSENIIQKTKENFLNESSNKYLFNESITIDSKNVNIREVDNFATASNKDINIHFTTVQGLHSQLNSPSENSITYEEFENIKTVLLADEAHHLNAETKTSSQRTKTEEQNLDNWEGTVKRLLNTNSENILIEYTATANLDNPSIREKYDDKLLYQYPLEDYRKDKFSKEVNVIEADLDKMDRALYSVILSQYRRKLAEQEAGLSNFKPVILMKSKTISNSEDNKEAFIEEVQNLDEGRIKQLKSQIPKNHDILNKVFTYFEENNISYSNLAKEIQLEFNESKILEINSRSKDDEIEEKERLVNTLEDQSNNIRVIFCVQKLTEGWDVLNLFDIVRLDGGIGPKTTVQEAQLIGRGARYFPFKIENHQDEYKRKYDNDISNKYRVLEELYYHSEHNPEYISQLKDELQEQGIKPKDEDTEELELNVKDDFKDTDVWQSGHIFINRKKQKEKHNITSLSEVINLTHSYELKTGHFSQGSLFEDEVTENETETVVRKFSLVEFGENVIYKALHRNQFYTYRNVSKYFGSMDSIEEFIKSPDYLGSVSVEVNGPKEVFDRGLSQEEKLNITESVLDELEREIRNSTTSFEGTEEFYAEPISEIVKNKVRKLTVSDDSNAERGIPISETTETELRMNVSEKDWYIYEEMYGTDQEKYLVNFINDAMNSLKQDYTDVYLLRNESLFQIHRFDDGRTIEPDFVLFLKENDSDEPELFQLFIEPKGDFLEDNDEWKQIFLQDIQEKYDIQPKEIYDNENVSLIGLPFYTEQMKDKFSEQLSEALEIDKLY